MNQWLSIEITLATLLATTFSCAGFLALWAATSPRHWFVRAAVFLAALAPLLLVPAYEPLVAFVIQGAVVAGGLGVYRWRQSRRQGMQIGAVGDATRAVDIRFSLSTLLLVMALVAVSTPVAIKLPAQNVQAWRSVAMIGLACGLVTLTAASMFTSNRKVFLWPNALVLCLLAGWALSKVDWFAHAIVTQGDWPPTEPVTTIPKFMSKPPDPPALTWPLTLPTMAILLVFMLLLCAFMRGRRSGMARLIAAASLVLIAAFPLYMLWKLLHPLPVPQAPVTDPNAYDYFVAAGESFNKSLILSTRVSPTSTAQLAAEVAKYHSMFDQVRFALSLPCQAPILPIQATPVNSPFGHAQSIRSVARAFHCEADLAEREGRFRDEARIALDHMRLGEASARGGLIPHYLVGIAVEGIGQAPLYRAIPHLDAPACRETIEGLQRIGKQREPLETVFHRDRSWCEHSWGWYGHLLLVLNDIVDRNPGRKATIQATARIATVRYLLMLELALRQYRLEIGALPARLEGLVPKYISALPADLMDPNHRPPRYMPNGDGYLLYSVGFDHDDDGGRPSSRENGWLDDGDMRLDSYFEPEETENAANGDEQASASEPAAEKSEE